MNIDKILKLNKGKLSVDQVDELIREYINKRVMYDVDSDEYLKNIKRLRSEATTRHQKTILNTAIKVEKEPGRVFRQIKRSKSVGDQLSPRGIKSKDNSLNLSELKRFNSVGTPRRKKKEPIMSSMSCELISDLKKALRLKNNIKNSTHTNTS